MQTMTATANNACSAPTLSTFANVTVSDGDQYQVRTIFRSKKETSAEFITDDSTTTIAVEGPYVWVRKAGEESLAGDAENSFAVGHQFLAGILYFDQFVIDIKPDDNIIFQGTKHKGRSGSFPRGGTISQVFGNENERPLGLIVQFPNDNEMAITYDDWHLISDGIWLPRIVVIDDEGIIFTYNFASIELEELGTLDFQAIIDAPALDEINLYRLHRALLNAHCLGDAKMMAKLSTPTTIIANRGEVIEATQDYTLAQFKSLFDELNYTSYHDLKDPQITVAQSGDLGWAVVNVRAEGEAIESDASFSTTWAWAMLARKINGVWLHAGNASNSAPDK